MNKLLISALLIGMATLASCKKTNKDDVVDPVTPPVVNKIAPDGFNYATSKNVTVNLSLTAANGEALSGVIVSIYNPALTDQAAAIYKGVTDKNGNLNAQISVPTSLSSVIIDPAYVGLLHNAQANINGNTVTASIGGAKGFGGDIVAQTINSTPSTGLTVLSLFNPINLAYPLPYYTTADAIVNTTSTPQSYGVPKYLEATGDVVGASLLNYVNASLPESKALTTTHPDYLLSTATADINVTAKADVWITFVSEGAGNTNTLGYYTYTTGNPPKSESDINTATIIFPNASASGTGGGMLAGNKVKLGTFNAGTSIGFVLFQSGWTGLGVNVNATRFYSTTALNPESTTALRKHSVALYDNIHNLTLVGFEDLNRQVGGSDNDFNDLVFYASSNPITGISATGVAPIDKGGDTDGDGVMDILDAFPNDLTKAYVSYFPSQTGYATLAFEDNWPAKGDYDMNDLVLNYRYMLIANALNQVVIIQGEYAVAAAGASFKNGFGVQFPFAASAVASVTGQRLKDTYIKLAPSGVEAGQTNAVIIPFDNHDALISNPDGSFFINTLNAKNKISSTVATVVVTLAAPMAQANIPISSINPFLISNERRAYEIHLPGYAPTNLADVKYLGTGDDSSLPSSGKYYLSKENWPWAISFNQQFTYPLETSVITGSYLHFADWAATGGTTYTDWYSNTTAGYRTVTNLYTK